MADDTTLEVAIEADASDAIRDMRAAADAVAGLGDSFREIATVAASAARSLNKIEKGITGASRASKGAAGASQEAAQAMLAGTGAAGTYEDAISKSAAAVARWQSESGSAMTQTARMTAAQVRQNAAWADGIGYATRLNAQIAKMGTNTGPHNPDAGSNSYRNINTSLGDARTLMDAESARMNKAIVASMRERFKAEDDLTNRILADSKSRVEAYTREFQAATKLDKELADSQQKRRYAEPINPARNVDTRSPGAKAAWDEQQANATSAAMSKYYAGMEKASAGTDSFRDSLFTARFALNDISQGASIAGAALLAFSVVGINAAGTYEDAMAGIQRTTSATSSQMTDIRGQFVELARTIPGGFDNLAQIGELAGQLNVPTERLAAFTETVAQFTSSTDASVQTSAEAFGRLDALLPDVQGNYEALGSAILNVGVNSVATESSIISTTTQIAAAGAQAGFTSSEIIGLAASYASLGIAPEAARGTTIRVFSEIRKAVTDGGEALNTFASLAGQSADTFKSAWLDGDSSAVFLDFLRGLQSEGANAETTLRNLGITGVRDINALLRLSQNVDVVTDSFSYASDGFTQATQLATAFGITSETLNSRLSVLGQSFEALLATLGESGAGPLKEFINGLIDLLGLLNELSKNPFAQWVTVAAGAFTILAGGMLILTAVVARFGALQIALRTTRMEIDAMSAAAVRGGTSLSVMGTKALAAGSWLTKMGNILKVGLVGAGITIGLTAIAALIDAIGEASKSSADKAREAWGDLSDVTAALLKDTEAAAQSSEKGARNYGKVAGKLTTVSDNTADWVTEMENATGAQTSLADETDRTTSSVTNFTYAIGDNTRQLLANKLANDGALKAAILTANAMERVGAPKAPTADVISTAVSGDTAGALAMLEKYRAAVEEFSRTNFAPGSAEAAKMIADSNGYVEELTKSITLADGALKGAADNGKVLGVITEAFGEKAARAAFGLDDMTDAAGGSSDAMSTLRDSVSGAFEGANALAAMTSAADALFSGLADSSNAFNVLSADGAQNVANLQNAIITTITAGEGLGLSAVDSVSALFLALQKQGIDTANLLASLANIPGIGVSGADQVAASLAGNRGLAPAANVLATAFDNVAKTAPRATRGMGGAGRAAKSAAKEIRTLADYAKDLSGVLGRAFEIRFGGGQGLDKITSSWINMSEGIAKANDELKEAQTRINELNTDNNSLMYFQQVAIDYGDALRAAEIADELAKNNEDLAKANKDAAAAQSSLDRGLVGNTKSAVGNRDELSGLVNEYQDYLSALASSGMSQGELQATAKKLRAEFVQQATQMGFNRTEVEKYAVAFDDMAIIIAKIPRNITIQASTSPALTALREFEARAKTSGTNAGRNFGGGFGGGVSAAMPKTVAPPVVKSSQWKDLGYVAGRAMRSGIIAGISTIKIGNRYLNSPGSEFTITGGQFASGGYTGHASTNEVAGVVHGKEYVINAENTQRLGIPFLNALNNGITPSTGGGTGNNGPMVVELSARDRALLAAAGNVSLSIDGKVIANSANAANFVSAQKGAN